MKQFLSVGTNWICTTGRTVWLTHFQTSFARKKEIFIYCCHRSSGKIRKFLYLYAFVCIVFGDKSLILYARGGTRARNPSFTNPAIARFGEYDSPFVCIFVCIQNQFIHTISWIWLLQSPESLLQKGANNALYWQKICGQSEFLTISPRIFPMSMPTT